MIEGTRLVFTWPTGHVKIFYVQAVILSSTPMVRHIILWTLRPELSENEKEAIKAGIKEGLEGLQCQIPGLLKIKVLTQGRLSSSTADLMLDSTFESPEALMAYRTNPLHVAVAEGKVRPFTFQRSCLDFEMDSQA